MSDEIPYESDVLIEKIYEEDHIDRVYATIVVEKETQKGMIVGQKGAGIKRIGKSAREVMEKFAGKKIFLDLHVSVKKGWSKNRESLEEFGYII
jgi:GTP-binding protein Era